MSYAKEEWKVYKSGRHFIIDKGRPICSDEVAKVYYSEANAHLIATAVNACQAVNPNNPQAVAESIKELYEALKTLVETLEIQGDELAEAGIGYIPEYNKAIEALAKAEGR